MSNTTNKKRDFEDVNQFGTNDLPLPAIFCHCGVDGTYRMYSRSGKYVDLPLNSGSQYLGPFTKITTTSDTAVDAGAIVVRF